MTDAEAAYEELAQANTEERRLQPDLEPKALGEGKHLWEVVQRRFRDGPPSELVRYIRADCVELGGTEMSTVALFQNYDEEEELVVVAMIDSFEYVARVKERVLHG
jgi:hypothetical protein